MNAFHSLIKMEYRFLTNRTIIQNKENAQIKGAIITLNGPKAIIKYVKSIDPIRTAYVSLSKRNVASLIMKVEITKPGIMSNNRYATNDNTSRPI
jgi:hypothetical protein